MGPQHKIRAACASINLAQGWTKNSCLPICPQKKMMLPQELRSFFETFVYRAHKCTIVSNNGQWLRWKGQKTQFKQLTFAWFMRRFWWNGTCLLVALMRALVRKSRFTRLQWCETVWCPQDTGLWWCTPHLKSKVSCFSKAYPNLNHLILQTIWAKKPI